ncbi:hypothetical protein Taro_050123 [Colocasia esculenta]|uniref:Uncharacterized protein n=1 Tax=Colocasia esculenta TaxID=4460 RepID=A0A843XD77_COLES|nr:hypothetical protein [Colocasia esculenta]
MSAAGMAGELGDAEFRLPSEFLGDDFFLEVKGGGGGDGGCCFPTEFPYELGYDSNLSSPVESVTGTESSSDEEDYMAGLTRQMAHYFLQDDEKGPASPFAVDNPKGTLTVGSPQSTLCAPSRESSNGPSLVSSPPSTPLEPYKDDAWDLLYAAAGQVMRMRLNDDTDQTQQQQQLAGRGLLASPAAQKPSAPAPASLPKNAASGYANLSLAQHQLRVTQYQQLKQQQMMKQQGAAAWSRQSRAKDGGTGGGLAGGRPARPLGLSASAWPPIQQPSRSGMRAVFLNPASRRESCGTGVFLPRRHDNPAELRKKPACSTVLLPARVVQALNLNLDELGAHPRFPGTFALDHDAIMARSNAMLLQKRGYRHQPAPAAVHHHQQEICLPSEWTY